ncbi:DUF58 domain-containing protein [Candidatus Woesearchaeota archaeon]|nr:DUF58 domain-containing protein [Candidatus Woesearchaeota archaeon]
MIDTTFLASLARFNLIVRKRVTSNYTGQRQSTAKGRGMLFKDHRIYAHGDDYRAIDWKVYARTDDLMIKQFEEEKNLVVHVIMDTSNSMHYKKKFDYAAMLGVGHAYLAMKRNDKFQFSTFGTGIDIFQPQRGMSQMMSMISYLNSCKPAGKTDFPAVARKYRHSLGSRGLVVIISDFLMPLEEIEEGLIYFSGHEVKLIQVLDEQEAYPTFEGDFKLKDSESGKMLRMFQSPVSRDLYLDRLAKHQDELRQMCGKLGMDFHTAHTGMPIFDAFYSVLG